MACSQLQTRVGISNPYHSVALIPCHYVQLEPCRQSYFTVLHTRKKLESESLSLWKRGKREGRERETDPVNDSHYHEWIKISSILSPEGEKKSSKRMLWECIKRRIEEKNQGATHIDLEFTTAAIIIATVKIMALQIKCNCNTSNLGCE